MVESGLAVLGRLRGFGLAFALWSWHPVRSHWASGLKA